MSVLIRIRITCVIKAQAVEKVVIYCENTNC